MSSEIDSALDEMGIAMKKVQVAVNGFSSISAAKDAKITELTAKAERLTTKLGSAREENSNVTIAMKNLTDKLQAANLSVIEQHNAYKETSAAMATELLATKASLNKFTDVIAANPALQVLFQ